jgi:hypothetical protein
MIGVISRYAGANPIDTKNGFHAAPDGANMLMRARFYKQTAPTVLGVIGYVGSYKHAPPDEANALLRACVYRHAAPTVLGIVGNVGIYKHAAPDGAGCGPFFARGYVVDRYEH